MVALLTYDDSVKRLLFAKKIPNHDVLSGLLQTLQQRIKQRKPNAVGNFRQQLSSPPAGLSQSMGGNGVHNLSNLAANSSSGAAGGSLGAMKK